MSIYGTFFTIEDERQWISELEAKGVGAAVIRDGEPHPDDLDAPIVYQGSNVIPSESDPRGGSVDLAHISKFVRFWRDNPDAPTHEEPEGLEPFVRLCVHSDELATVVLTAHQVRRLRDSLDEWLSAVSS